MRVDKLPLDTATDVAALYGKKPFKEVITGMHNNPKLMPKESRTYQIYTVNSFFDLVNVVKKKYLEAFNKVNEEGSIISSEEYMDLHSIRYLLTENNELLFAEEGSQPAHWLMTGQTEKASNSRCRCAGNLRFNDDFTQIEFINNKSGDFKPEDVLLRKLLAVIVVLAEKNLIPLQDSLEIEHRKTFTNYMVSFDVLRQYVYQVFDAGQLEAFVWVNQNALHREVRYQPKQMEIQRTAPLAAKSCRGRLDLSDEAIQKLDSEQPIPRDVKSCRSRLDLSERSIERFVLPKEPKSLLSFQGALFSNSFEDYANFDEKANSFPKETSNNSSHSLSSPHKRKRNAVEPMVVAEVSNAGNQVREGFIPKRIKFSEEENKEEFSSTVTFS